MGWRRAGGCQTAETGHSMPGFRMAACWTARPVSGRGKGGFPRGRRGPWACNPRFRGLRVHWKKYHMKMKNRLVSGFADAKCGCERFNPQPKRRLHYGIFKESLYPYTRKRRGLRKVGPQDVGVPPHNSCCRKQESLQPQKGKPQLET